MPRTVTKITIFLASPSDVARERDVVAAGAEEWNARHGKDRSVMFEVLRWETSVSASFGTDGQDVVNNQIEDDYDVLIGLFWQRLGSPTPRAESGTVEEYDRALSRLRSGEEVDIAILFKDAPASLRDADLDQLSKLRQFERNVQQAGAFTKTFKDDDGLKLELGILLDRLARKHGQASGGLERERKPSQNGPRLSVQHNEDISSDRGDDSDLGLFDIVEDMENHAAAAGKFLDGFNEALELLSSTTSQVTVEHQSIKGLLPLEPKNLKPGISRIAASMDSLSQFLEERIAAYAENLNALGNDARNMVRVSYDWIDTEENMSSSIDGFKQVLGSIYQNISGNQESLSEMLHTTQKLQRTTSVFNRAKRRMIQNASRLIEVNESGKAIIGLAIDEIGRLLLAVGQHDTRSRITDR